MVTMKELRDMVEFTHTTSHDELTCQHVDTTKAVYVECTGAKTSLSDYAFYKFGYDALAKIKKHGEDMALKQMWMSLHEQFGSPIAPDVQELERKTVIEMLERIRDVSSIHPEIINHDSFVIFAHALLLLGTIGEDEYENAVYG